MTETLINDLLDLAKLENNQLLIHKEYFNLGYTVYEALQMLKFSANQVGVQL